jgi:hypothetical protein
MKIPKAQIAEARANLLAAPAKEDVGSVRAAILQMRGELMAALIEKNWSFIELRDWLATQGIEVSLAALQRYLVGVRAARKSGLAHTADRASKPNSSGADAAPTTPTRTAGQGSAQANPVRVIPSMPRPVPPMPSVSGQAAKARDPSVPRASSFPVRRDRENI